MKAKKTVTQPTTKPLPRGRRPVIQVTDMDIEAAIPKTSSHCMIADAIKRAFPEVTGIRVDVQTIRWSDKRKGLRYIYYTPALVIAILIAWDQGIRPKPFSFKLRGPQITSMRVQEAPGVKKRKLAHRLGKKKRRPQKRDRSEHQTIVGGKPPALISVETRRYGSRQLSHLLTAEELRRIQAVVQR